MLRAPVSKHMAHSTRLAVAPLVINRVVTPAVTGAATGAVTEAATEAHIMEEEGVI